jgi:hypothetical protein
MFNVRDNQLVIEEKGVYSVEKFLLSRRLMYWQVYLHKTGLCAELILTNILKRAKELAVKEKDISRNEVLDFFLTHNGNKEMFNKNKLQNFAKLDDYDIVMAIKTWQSHPDKVLNTLCKMLINRDLFKVKLKKSPFKADKINIIRHNIQERYKLSKEETGFFVYEGKTSNQAYSYEYQQIMILYKNGNLKEISQISDQLNLKTLAKPVVKFYICYPKDIV